MKMRPQSDRDYLLHFWLLRLQDEHSAICHAHGVELRPPIFEISSGKNQLGCWHNEGRCIKISENLIVSYPWATTLQVLRHEMAHQYCSEILGDQESGHGKSFRQACEIMGVLPQFRVARVISDEFLQNLDDGETQGNSTNTILRKIEKLLALGDSSNVHEAELALEKARLLIDKYQVQQLGAKQDDNYAVLVIGMGSRQVATYRRLICRILQDFFYVRVVLSETYLPLQDESQKSIEILGTRENTAVAEYCYHFLENNLEQLWDSFRKGTGAKGRRAKNSYYLGVVTGFYQKLESQGESSVPVKIEEKELMLIEDQRLNDFLHMCFPRLRKSGSRRSTVQQEVYSRGVEEGQKLSLRSGVSRGESPAPRLIR